MAAPKILCVGEGMLEISGAPGAWGMGYGGDTLNTAIHLARAGFNTGYFSALGADPFSAHLRASWEAEKVDCSLVLADPDRACGLYGITLDQSGERRFVYWRDNSAARHMFALPTSSEALATAARAKLLYFSLISLAILPDAGREALLGLAHAVRDQGGMVAFDANYRERLWPSREVAHEWRDRAVSGATIGLPSIDDEIALSGEMTATEVAENWRALGCIEVAVKMGAAGCQLDDGYKVAAMRGLAVVDTSGAGDAFNAGYLSQRLSGRDVRASAIAGNRLAGWVVTQHGAIPPRPQNENKDG